MILVPPIVWMELKFKRTGTYRDTIVKYSPRVPYRTIYESERYVLVPMTQPQPQWRVARNFIPGSYVMEAYTRDVGDLSVFMWDLPDQDDWQSGEEIIADVCTVARG